MGGFAMLQDSKNGTQQFHRVYLVDLLDLFKNTTVAWPDMKDSDIDNRTQGDKLVKAIALFQIIWSVAQIPGRLSNGFTVTIVELFTVSIVLCAVITYLAWWHKASRCPGTRCLKE
jgi:hypothetical protein